jgi:hypothetical protein
MAAEIGLRPSISPAHPVARLATAVAKGLSRVVLFDHYRPEQHYMRGPGPRWHAKHDPVPVRVYSQPRND